LDRAWSNKVRHISYFGRPERCFVAFPSRTIQHHFYLDKRQVREETRPSPYLVVQTFVDCAISTLTPEIQRKGDGKNTILQNYWVIVEKERRLARKILQKKVDCQWWGWGVKQRNNNSRIDRT